jgi:hypothetical protein
MRNLVRQVALTVGLTVGAAVFGLAPAHATYVSWNLTSPTGAINSGCNTTSTCTQTYYSGTYDIQATAYHNSGLSSTTIKNGIVGQSYTSTTTWHAEALYGKNAGAGEIGLGIKSDPTGDHEIYGTHFIQISVVDALRQGLNTFLFSMGSTTQLEQWSVYGASSTGLGTRLTLLITGADSNTHNLSGYSYYDFFYNSALGSASGQGNNVLLASFSATLTSSGGGQGSSTPLPAALPLFASGLGVMGLLGWRRKRKRAAASAAV